MWLILKCATTLDVLDKMYLYLSYYYLRTPDYTLYSGVYVCWSEHSDSSFIYVFMSLDYGLGTMTATTSQKKNIYCWYLFEAPITFLWNKTIRKVFKSIFLLYRAFDQHMLQKVQGGREKKTRRTLL